MRETRTVSLFTCDSPSCTQAVYREVDADGLPAGYHATLMQVDGDGNARGVDFWACSWDHLPASASGALQGRAETVEAHQVPEHPSRTDAMPVGGGGLQGNSLTNTPRRSLSEFESSYDHSGGSEATSFKQSENLELGGSSYASGYGA